MKKRTVLELIAFILGLWLLFDSMFAILFGRYFSSTTLSPWADVLRNFNIDPFQFAPGILALGILWLSSMFALMSRYPRWRSFYGTTAVLTTWYLPVGTFLSLTALVLILSGLLPRRFQRYRIITVGTLLSAGVIIVLMTLLNFSGAS